MISTDLLTFLSLWVIMKNNMNTFLWFRFLLQMYPTLVIEFILKENETIHISYICKTKAVDDLVTQGARSLTGIILTYIYLYSLSHNLRIHMVF